MIQMRHETRGVSKYNVVSHFNSNFGLNKQNGTNGTLERGVPF